MLWFSLCLSPWLQKASIVLPFFWHFYVVWIKKYHQCVAVSSEWAKF